MVASALFALLLAGPNVQKDVVYRTVDGTDVKMDLYLPENPVRKPAPIVFVIHGGAWISGKKDEMTPLAEELTRRGVAVANLDYRLAPKAKWPAMIDDCQEAVRFVLAHASEYKVDTKRMGAVGGSAGAHLAMLLGFTDNMGPGNGPSARVKAVVNLFGPVDLTQDFEKNLANMIATQVLGEKYDPASDKTKFFSPINHVDAKSAPVFTIQGKADPLVPWKQAERLDEAMKRAHKEHQMILVEGLGHGVSSKDPKVDAEAKAAVEKAADWLIAKLKS